MTPKETAEQVVNKYRMVLMHADTQCGDEILCTHIAKQCALHEMQAVSEALANISGFAVVKALTETASFGTLDAEIEFIEEVRKEIRKL